MFFLKIVHGIGFLKNTAQERHPVICKMEVGHSLSAFRFRFRQSRQVAMSSVVAM